MALIEQKDCAKKPVTFRSKHYKEGELTPEIKKLLSATYQKNEIIVIFPKQPSDAEVKEVEATLLKVNIKITKRIKCDNCDIPIQLWKGKNAHTIVNADGVKSGAGPTSTRNVGEEYCLNYKNIIPNSYLKKPKPSKAQINKKKKKIVVAVLDTGIDTQLIDKEYIYNEASNSDSPCYRDVTSGWNFTADDSENRIGNPNVEDDNEGKHGTIVTQFIINQFKKSKNNRVEILPLKTHDKSGVGDLFRIICAIHFAIAKKVDIINASWGLYYYAIEPIPYLKELITKRLKEEGIVFIAAAGNFDQSADDIARALYREDPGQVLTDDDLRNLEIHHFYPANLSSPNNTVITATTTNGTIVSPRQNYSNELVDIGILADDKEEMAFEVPFENTKAAQRLPGSSFAAAIATGIIGAYCPADFFRNYSADNNMKKHKILKFLKEISSGQPGKININTAELFEKYIIGGCWTKKTG